MYDSYTSTVGEYRTYPLGFTHNRSCGSRSSPCQPHSSGTHPRPSPQCLTLTGTRRRVCRFDVTRYRFSSLFERLQYFGDPSKLPPPPLLTLPIAKRRRPLPPNPKHTLDRSLETLARTLAKRQAVRPQPAAVLISIAFLFRGRTQLCNVNRPSLKMPVFRSKRT